MSDEPEQLPIYLMSLPPTGVIMNDKDGNPCQVISWPIQGVGIETIKSMFLNAFDAELSDQNAEILDQGGRVKLVGKIQDVVVSDSQEV